MKLTELLEQDRETLLRSLHGAPGAERATEVIERELERMLFAFNDAAPSPRARESAANMMGTLRSALPLLCCVGDVRVLEHREGGKDVRIAPLPLLLLILGCAACLAAAGFMLYEALPPLLAALPLAGGLLLAFAGARMGKRKTNAEYQTEITTDWEKVYRTLHTAALVMDQALEESEAAERWEARRRDGETPALTKAECELMAGLLEAAYSGDGEFALEKLGAVRNYLRDKGVEIVECDAEHAQYFDRMPGTKAETLCPALLQGAQVLRRGVATVPER